MKIKLLTILLVALLLGGLVPFATLLQASEYLHLGTNPPTASKESFEHSHRSKKLRTYWLQEKTGELPLEAWLVQSDGKSKPLELSYSDQGTSLGFKTRWGDESKHGHNRVFLVDSSQLDGITLVRTAQWLTLNHSCAWGHDYKFDDKRLELTPDGKAPLEISPKGLWDSNFHDQLDSAQMLDFQILHYGKPAAGAKLSITTGKGWKRELLADDQGLISFHLIRDHYPQSWADFHASHNQRVLFEASYFKRGTHYTATLPYRYVSSPYDYKSFSLGLGAIVVSILGSVLVIVLMRRRRRIRFKEEE